MNLLRAYTKFKVNYKFSEKMMADNKPDSVEGNLYQITLGRITNITLTTEFVLQLKKKSDKKL